MQRGVVLPCLLLVIGLSGCQSTPKSSRIAIEDYEQMAAQMALSLRRSDALTQRTPTSQTWIVSFDKVLNLSSEIMTRSEQWSVMAGLQASQPIDALWEQKRVVFVIPAQHAIDRRGTIDAERADKGFGSERAVTHVIIATFRSVTRAAGDGESRSDVYACEFQMLDLRTGEPVWLDTFEFKRRAQGSIRD